MFVMIDMLFYTFYFDMINTLTNIMRSTIFFEKVLGQTHGPNLTVLGHNFFQEMLEIAQNIQVK